jgi:dipeptidyl aminopeptidase/acylaminoacyl peptidase
MNKNKVAIEVDNLKLIGEFYTPGNVQPPYPAVCFCHGIPATQYNPAEGGYPVLAERFCKAGFATMVFNFRGTGPSQGNLDLPAWTHDLKAVIDYLYERKEVDKSRIAVLGSSGGAAVSVYVAADEIKICSLVTLACPASFHFSEESNPESVVEHFRSIGAIRDKDFPPSTEEWLQGFGSIAPIDYIEKISPRPLYMIHGDEDDLIPVEHAYQLYEKARMPKEMMIIPGAGHRLRLEERAVKAALDWLVEKMEVQVDSV